MSNHRQTHTLFILLLFLRRSWVLAFEFTSPSNFKLRLGLCLLFLFQQIHYRLLLFFLLIGFLLAVYNNLNGFWRLLFRWFLFILLLIIFGHSLNWLKFLLGIIFLLEFSRNNWLFLIWLDLNCLHLLIFIFLLLLIYLIRIPSMLFIESLFLIVLHLRLSLHLLHPNLYLEILKLIINSCKLL